MKVCVCVKQVPDPNLPMRVDPGTKRLVRGPAQSILDPADEYGLEAALSLVEQHQGEVVAISMGTASAEDALRRALAMGADRAVLITDDALAGSDAMVTARVLAAAIKAEQPDLVVCATESTDAYSGMVPGALAELLGVPQLTFARSVSADGNTLTVQRDTETGYQTVQAELPALMTVTASIGEPRYPSFKGLMAAKKKPLEKKDVAALGPEAGSVGDAGSRERVVAVEALSQEKQGKIVTDDGSGDSVEEIVAFLKQIQIV